jgi:hypothetical protein
MEKFVTLRTWFRPRIGILDSSMSICLPDNGQEDHHQNEEAILVMDFEYIVEWVINRYEH